MEVRKYTFGNVTFRVESPVPLLKQQKFEAFAASEIQDDDFVIEIHAPNSITENRTNLSQRVTPSTCHVFIKEQYLPQITIANVFSVAKVANLLPEKNAYVLHCSYVLYEEKAILFCAPCETGKSTQAAFWEKCRGTTTVNEDRAVIFKQNDIYYAGGCWATGHATTCLNITAPIAKIVLLGQGRENRVYSVSVAEMLQRILLQCSFDDKNQVQSQHMINLVLDLLDKVSVVAFDCIKDESSVDELEKYL